MASRRVEAELDALDSLTARVRAYPGKTRRPDAELIAMAYPRDAGDVHGTIAGCFGTTTNNGVSFNLIIGWHRSYSTKWGETRPHKSTMFTALPPSATPFL